MKNKKSVDEVRVCEIKEFVTKGYKDIFLRYSDPNGLKHYSSLIYSGKMTREIFLEKLAKQVEMLTKRVDYLESRLQYHMNDIGSHVYKMGHDCY